MDLCTFGAFRAHEAAGKPRRPSLPRRRESISPVFMDARLRGHDGKKRKKDYYFDNLYSGATVCAPPAQFLPYRFPARGEG